MKYSQRIFNERGEPATSLFNGEVNLDAEGRFRIDDLIPGVIQLEGFRRYFDVELPKTNDDYVIDLAAPMPTKSTQPAPANVAPPVASAASKSCVVQATIVTDDEQPLGSDGTCWIMSRTLPDTSGKETRYGSTSGQRASIQNGKLSTRVDAGMISVCITVPGYAPAIVGLKETKPGETLDLGTITVKRGFTWKLTIRIESDQPVPSCIRMLWAFMRSTRTIKRHHAAGKKPFPFATRELRHRSGSNRSATNDLTQRTNS